MKASHAILMTLLTAVIISVGLYAGLGNIKMGQVVTGAPSGDGDGAQEQVLKTTAQCPDDGYTDIDVQYENVEADTATAVASDVRIDDGGHIVFSATDNTTSSYGSYATILNKVLCGQGITYKVYIGDETEEYYRKTEITPSSPKSYALVEGAVIGDIETTGYEDGTVESTLNVTLGSGEGTSDVQLKFKENESNNAFEAKDGLMVVFAYNGTLYDGVKVTNLGADEVSCPAGAPKLTTTDDSKDGTTECYTLDTTYLGAFESITADLFIDVAASENPTQNRTYDRIEAVLVDQNMYVDGDDGNKIKYGYFDEDDSDIGKTSMDTKTIYMC